MESETGRRFVIAMVIIIAILFVLYFVGMYSQEVPQ